MKPTSNKLKKAAISYLRKNTSIIVATEVLYSRIAGIADVLCDTGKEVIEVEVKVEKCDVLKQEWSKVKHNYWNSLLTGGRSDIIMKHVPNKFYLLVPDYYIKMALKEIEKRNPNYGLLVYDTLSGNVREYKHAINLHAEYNNSNNSVIRNIIEKKNMSSKGGFC